MTMHRKAYGAETTTLAEKRQVRVICSTPEVDRAGDIVVQEGIDLTAYQSNPVVLWQHDPEQPIARCVSIGVEAGKLTALVQFPPEGTSAKADEVYGLIKAGVINATSIGFMEGDCQPLKSGGLRFNTCELAEFSFVSIPANRSATVVERAHGGISAQEVSARKASAARLREAEALRLGVVSPPPVIERNCVSAQEVRRRKTEALRLAVPPSTGTSKAEPQSPVWGAPGCRTEAEYAAAMRRWLERPR